MKAAYRQQEALQNDALIRAVDPEYSGRLVCPVTVSGRLMKPVKKEDSRAEFLKMLRKQEDDRRAKENESRERVFLENDDKSQDCAQDLDAILDSSPVSTLSSISEGEVESSSGGGHFSSGSTSSSTSSPAASEGVMSAIKSKQLGKIPLSQMLRAQQQVARIKAESHTQLFNPDRSDPSEPYRQMASLYAPAYSANKGNIPPQNGSPYMSPYMSPNQPGKYSGSPSTQFSLASAGGSSNWEPSYSPSSSTGQTSPHYSPQNSFPPSPLNNQISPRSSRSPLHAFAPPPNRTSQPMAQPPNGYRPAGGLPFGGASAAAAAAAAAASGSGARGHGQSKSLCINMNNSAEVAWLKEQQLMAQHQQYLQRQGGGRVAPGVSGLREKLLVRVASNASSESAFSDYNAEESDEIDFSGVVSDCLNFNDVERECQALDSEKRILESVSIAALSASRLAGPGAPEMVLFALHVADQPAPILPGDRSTQLLFPQYLQKAARVGQQEGGKKGGGTMEKDEFGWVQKAKPAVPQFASYKKDDADDELESYLFG